jgi:WD40 repeat protein
MSGATPTNRAPLDHRGAIVHAALFLPDGRIATGDGDGLVRIWSADGRPERILRGHLEAVRCLDYSVDRKQLVSGGVDNTLRLWNVDDGSCRTIEFAWGTDKLPPTSKRVPIAGSGVLSARFGKGRWLTYGSGAGNTGFLDLVNGDQPTLWRPQTGAYRTLGLASMPGGLVLVADLAPKPRIVDPEAQRPYWAPYGHTEPIVALHVAPDGRLFSTSTDGSIRIWNPGSTADPEVVPWPECGGLMAPLIALRPGGEVVVMGGRGMEYSPDLNDVIAPTTSVWNTTAPYVRKRFGWTENAPRSLASPPAGPYAIYGTYSGVVIAIDLRDVIVPPVVLERFSKKAVRAAANLGPDECVLGADDGQVALVTVSGSAPQFTTFELGDNQKITALASFPGQPRRALVATGDDGRLLVLDMRHRLLERKVVDKHGAAVMSIATAPKGDMAATGDARGVVHLWDLSRPDAIVERCHLDLARGDVPNALAFSLDGSQLYIGSSRTEIIVCDVGR